MNEDAPLSAAARELLAVHARAMSPPHDGASVLAATRARLAASESAPTLGRRPAWLVVVGAASAIAVVLGLARPNEPDEPQRERASDDAAAPVVAPDAAPRREIAAVLEPSAKPPTVAIERAASARVDVPQPRVDRKPTAARDHAPIATQPDSPSTLADELALLGKARNALARGSLDEAGAALDAHAARHPDGKLREERTAMVVMLACESDRPGATAQAHEYLAREASRPYRARVRKSCEPSGPQ